MTVMWHVDDLKVSHKDYNEITKFLVFWGKQYQNHITVTRGVCTIILEWTSTSTRRGGVKVSMIKYLKKIFVAFPEKITSIAATIASDHLFE